MKITLTRYFYIGTITKCRLAIYMGEDEEPTLECEAHETMFRDYTDKFPGCSDYCMPVGTYNIKVKSGVAGPMTMHIMKVPGHMAMQICWHPIHQTEHCRVLVGEATNEDPMMSRLTKQQETYKKIEELIYEAYIKGEEMRIEINNRPTPALPVREGEPSGGF